MGRTWHEGLLFRPEDYAQVAATRSRVAHPSTQRAFCAYVARFLRPGWFYGMRSLCALCAPVAPTRPHNLSGSQRLSLVLF